MPPTNTTPATAIAIPSLPYNSGPFDAASAPDGTGYPSTCDSGQRNATWWKYTPTAGQYVIAILADVEDRGHVGGLDWPTVSVWTGTLPALTQYEVNGLGDSQDFCGNTSGGFWFLVPVAPGTTYYFQVTQGVDPGGAGIEQNWTFQVLPPPNQTAPAGSLMIPDDTDGFRAAILSADDGSFRRYLPFPAGEFGAVLPNGTLCVQDGEADVAVKLYAADLQTVIASVDYSPAFIMGITHDFNNKFYVVTWSGVGTNGTVRRLSDTGVEEDTWTIPNAHGSLALAVTRDGGILYYTFRNAPAEVIRAYDLVGDAPLSNLTAGFAGEAAYGTGDGWVNADGTICFGFRASLSPYASKMRRFNPGGSVTATINIGNALQHLARAWDDTSFWVWLNKNTVDASGFDQFRRYAFDGTLLTQFDVPVGGGGDPAAADEPFSMSGTCPLLVLAEALPTVPAVPPRLVGSPGPLAWVEARWRTPGSP